MMDVRDPLDRLRAANPVLLLDTTLSPPDPVLFRSITSDAPVTTTPRPRRRAHRLLPALLATSVVGGVAAYALLRGEVTVPEKAACYESADLTAATDVATVDERGPAAACADLWRRGVFGAGVEVPTLTECVLDTGIVGVFPASPGQDVCTALNIPPVPTSAPSTTSTTAVPSQPPSDPNARVLVFRDAIAGPFVDSPCVEPAAAAALVRRELNRAGLGDWTVRGGEFSAERPCATFSLRPENKEVVLVPSPRR